MTDMQKIVPFKGEGPQPLFREVPKGEAYPVDALGPLAPVAKAIADITKAPVAIAGQSVLSAASLAVQAHGDVETLGGGGAPLSLFCLTVAASGERKSTCDKLALKGLRDHERETSADYGPAMASNANEREIWKLKRDRLSREAAGGKKGADPIAAKADLEALGAEPEPPTMPNRTATDPTFEGLAKLFLQSNPSLGIFSDEAGQFFGGHGMNSDNRLKTCAGLSTLWDGSALNRTRAGDGAITLSGKRLAVHMMAQPVAVGPLLADPMANQQGFLARFLICQPESNIGFRDVVEHDPQSVVAIDGFAHDLQAQLESEALTSEHDDRELTPRMLPLSGAAKALLAGYYQATEQAQRPGGDLESVRPYASKTAEQAARIAGVLSLWADLSKPNIDAVAMGNGITLAQHHLNEALRLADAAVISEKLAKAEKLRRWLLDSWGKPEITPRDIVRFGPGSMRDTATAKEMIAILESHGWLVALPPETVIDGVARKESYRIVRGQNEMV